MPLTICANTCNGAEGHVTIPAIRPMLSRSRRAVFLLGSGRRAAVCGGNPQSWAPRFCSARNVPVPAIGWGMESTAVVLSTDGRCRAARAPAAPRTTTEIGVLNKPHAAFAEKRSTTRPGSCCCSRRCGTARKRPTHQSLEVPDDEGKIPAAEHRQQRPSREDLDAALVRGMPGSSMPSWAHLKSRRNERLDHPVKCIA